MFYIFGELCLCALDSVVQITK